MIQLNHLIDYMRERKKKVKQLLLILNRLINQAYCSIFFSIFFFLFKYKLVEINKKKIYIYNYDNRYIYVVYYLASSSSNNSHFPSLFIYIYI